jgi:hypothetical protein
MKTKQFIVLAVAVVVVVIVALGIGKKQVAVQQDESMAGCYVATLSRDVYTLTITSEQRGTVLGTVSFDNFEKDSSSGTFVGTYNDGLLVGDYTFESEGMTSVRQLAFKKVDSGFVAGFGEVEVVDDREMFKDVSDLDYDTSTIFARQDTCPQ